MTFFSSREKIIGGGIPPEELPKWAYSLYEGGLSEKEIRDILSRVSVSEEPKTSRSETINAHIKVHDAPDWVQGLIEGGFTESEVEDVLNRINMDADQKNEIRGVLNRIAVKDEGEETSVPVEVK